MLLHKTNSKQFKVFMFLKPTCLLTAEARSLSQTEVQLGVGMEEGEGHQPCIDDVLDLDKRGPEERGEGVGCRGIWRKW